MTYEFNDMVAFADKAASYVAYRYRKYGVEKDDCRSEIFVWLYGKGQSKVEKWLASEPQQTTRIYRSMLDVALLYAEQEKAQVAGYKPDDVWWYSPSSVEDLLPLALNASFTQENENIGNLIVMVLDVRRALDTTRLWDYFAERDEEHEDWRVNVQLLVDELGGERPAVGRRKSLSNAQAIAITGEGYE